MSQTHLTATGLIPGPETPPTIFPNSGFFRLISMTIPGPTVLMAVMASAPSASAALATSPMLLTLGLSLAKILVVFLTAWRTALTAAAVDSTPIPNGWPNSSVVLGQDRFSSIKSGLIFSTATAKWTKSETFTANTEQITGILVDLINSAHSPTPFFTPGFLSPTEFKMPWSYLTTRGMGLPRRGSMVMDLVVTPPKPYFSAW